MNLLLHIEQKINQRKAYVLEKFYVCKLNIEFFLVVERKKQLIYSEAIKSIQFLVLNTGSICKWQR